MNITSIGVMDPRLDGKYEDPFVFMHVDEEIVEIGEPIYNEALPRHRLIPCGPFSAAEVEAGVGHWVDISEKSPRCIDEINRSGLINHQLVSVKVYYDDSRSGGERWEYNLFMGVPRLRRILRTRPIDSRRALWPKMARPDENLWKVLVDEEAALEGNLRWRIDNGNPPCYGGAVPAGDQCILSPSSTVLFRDTHLPLCNMHRTQLERRMRSDRVRTR